MAFRQFEKLTRNKMLAIRNACRYSVCARHISRVQHYNPVYLKQPVVSPKDVQLSCLCRPYGDYASWWLKISSSSPILWAQEHVVAFHDFLEVPWWATIILVTFGLRTCLTFPLTVYQNHVLARYENLQPEIRRLAEELQRETAIATRMYLWTKPHATLMYRRSLKKVMNELIVRDNCHPLKATLVIWIQLPAWISLSFALRNMAFMLPYKTVEAELVFLQLSVGGTLWFPNLTSPDTLLIIPILLGVVNLLVVELHALRFSSQQSKLQTIATNVTRVLSIIMIPVAMSMPACVPLYWLCSSCYGLGQNILLLMPSVRRFLQIPKTPSESATPFKDVLTNLKRRFSRDSS